VDIVCLDLEGVLIPEIWINFAERTGIDALRATTRDIPDYDVLMRQRLDILNENKLTLGDIQEVIGGLGPMPGASAFLDALRRDYQVVILSDTFYEFAAPLMAQLGQPTLFCHRLLVDNEQRIVDYRLRLRDHKRAGVEAFKALNFYTIAAGDSYNDTTMLAAADRGILFRAPKNVIREFPQFEVETEYDGLRGAIDGARAKAA